MKAMIWTKYGSPDGLQIGEVEKPTPKDNEVLIKVHAATVTAGDCEMRSLKFPLVLSLPMRMYVGLTRPTRIKIIGQELAGEIESVGQDVKRFKTGDQVRAANRYIVDGKTDIGKLNEELGLKLPEDECETVGGFVLGLFGRLPAEGDQFRFENLLFTVLRLRKNRIARIRILKYTEERPERANDEYTDRA